MQQKSFNQFLLLLLYTLLISTLVTITVYQVMAVLQQWNQVSFLIARMN